MLFSVSASSNIECNLICLSPPSGVDPSTVQLLQKHGATKATYLFEPYDHVSWSGGQCTVRLRNRRLSYNLLLRAKADLFIGQTSLSLICLAEKMLARSSLLN